MKYRTLGKTGLTVSVIGYGTFQFLGDRWGTQFGQPFAERMVDTCRQTGINLLDTAPGYGNDFSTERYLGRAIARDREKWVVATKFGHGRENGKSFEAFDVDAARRFLDHSLQALDTDYIDIYQFHSGNDAQFNQPELWQMLREEQARGRIRHLGNSLPYARAADIGAQTESSGRLGIDVMQIKYNYLDPDRELIERELFPICREQRLGVMIREALCQGLLTGRYSLSKPNRGFSEGDFRARKYTEDYYEGVERFAAEAPAGVPLGQYALAWTLRQPTVSTVITGAKEPEQLAANAAAADLDLVCQTHPLAVGDPVTP